MKIIIVDHFRGDSEVILKTGMSFKPSAFQCKDEEKVKIQDK